jgi:hypothetical protein
VTVAEAIAQVEALFTVHDEVGSPISYEDQEGKVVGEGPRDMRTAPCGEKYATVSSFGVDVELPEDASVMFTSAGLAAQWWIDEVQDWAATIMSERTWWHQLHLYWRVKPAFVSTTYLAMDQGSLLRTQSPLASVLQIDLGFVTSEMLLSKIGPDGKED